MNDHEFDRRARALHGQALAALSPRASAQLHQQRHAALAAGTQPSRPARHWSWASASALALALAFVVPWRSQHEPAGDARVAQAQAPAVAGTALATLDQDPDFYLWLASSDAVALASE
jgi:hypothetical protein